MDGPSANLATAMLERGPQSLSEGSDELYLKARAGLLALRVPRVPDDAASQLTRRRSVPKGCHQRENAIRMAAAMAMAAAAAKQEAAEARYALEARDAVEAAAEEEAEAAEAALRQATGADQPPLPHASFSSHRGPGSELCRASVAGGTPFAVSASPLERWWSSSGCLPSLHSHRESLQPTTHSFMPTHSATHGGALPLSPCGPPSVEEAWREHHQRTRAMEGMVLHRSAHSAYGYELPYGARPMIGGPMGGMMGGSRSPMVMPMPRGFDPLIGVRPMMRPAFGPPGMGVPPRGVPMQPSPMSSGPMQPGPMQPAMGVLPPPAGMPPPPRAPPGASPPSSDVQPEEATPACHATPLNSVPAPEQQLAAVAVPSPHVPFVPVGNMPRPIIDGGEKPQAKRQRSVASDGALVGGGTPQSCSSPGPSIDTSASWTIERDWTACSTSASRVLAGAHAHHKLVSDVLDAGASSGSVLERPKSATADSTLFSRAQLADLVRFEVPSEQVGEAKHEALPAPTPKPKKVPSPWDGLSTPHACKHCKAAKVTCLDGTRPCARCVRLGYPCEETIKPVKHACTNCQRAKIRCERDAENNRCRRCQRFGLKCVPSEHNVSHQRRDGGPRRPMLPPGIFSKITATAESTALLGTGAAADAAAARDTPQGTRSAGEACAALGERAPPAAPAAPAPAAAAPAAVAAAATSTASGSAPAVHLRAGTPGDSGAGCMSVRAPASRSIWAMAP